jgi:hypothetical protein
MPVDERTEVRSRRRRLPAKDLGDDRVDVDRLVDRTAHAQVLERIASLHIRELQFVARLVEAQVLRADVGGLRELEATLGLEPGDVLERRIDDEIHLA